MATEDKRNSTSEKAGKLARSIIYMLKACIPDTPSVVLTFTSSLYI